MDNLRVVTRRSRLAMIQTEWVVAALKQQYPDLQIDILPMETEGDKHVDLPLTKVGGKGLFTKALETALLSKEADFAVHSLKDMPSTLPEGLTIAAIPKRIDPRDAFVALHYECLSDLPVGALVGTSSLRRQAQILALRPDINTTFLRGNVDTRLKKLAEKTYDAIILAVAGLSRLQCTDNIKEIFSVDALLPAVGQGALAIECRCEDVALHQLLKPLHDIQTDIEVTAERQLNLALGGNCQTPIAGYAVLADEQLTLRGLVASEDGKQQWRAKKSIVLQGFSENVENAEDKLWRDRAAALGQMVADMLLEQGAKLYKH